MATLALRSLGRVTQRFRRDDRGQIAIIFGLSLTGMVLATGAGLDLTRAYQARQMLYQVATLSCQYASRPSVAQLGDATYVAPNGGPTYTSAVGSYIQAALASQTFPWTQSNATPFTYTASGPADVSLAATVPTAFMQIVNVSQIPVSATSHCYDNRSTLTQRLPNNGSPYVIRNGFETASNGQANYIRIPGQSNTVASTSFNQTSNYTSEDGTQWYSTGYCLETDQVGQISATLPEGVRSAELDCENGSNSRGNSATSAKTYLPVGNYELRYFYRGRINYPNYDPVSICGSTASDVAWANDTNSAGGTAVNALRTNQMNVYLDLNTTGSPPMHTTIDGSQQLAGSNLIDVCVHATSWTERSVRIYISTPGFYWLSFAADGQNDSFGAQLDNVRLCTETCPGTVQDSFPPSWQAANNGGVNKLLFQDSFESPIYAADTPPSGPSHAKGGNLANSQGTTVSTGCTVSGGGTSSYPSPPGWPCQTSAGWATAPYNETWFWMQGASQGQQFLSLQGSNAFSNASDPINRAVSRKFLLSPGYYNVSYYYTSLMDFSYDFIYGTSCTAAPTSAPSYNAFGIKNGHPYSAQYSAPYSQYRSTNAMNVYMSDGQLISTPSINSTLGGAPTYTNPDGSTSASPTVAPDRGTIFAAYNASAVNPVIDHCYYSSGFAWVARSVNVKILKPGQYWLTFSAQGDPLTANGAGPGIDDVKLTALGSLSMSGAPTTALTTIPVASPQPGSIVTPTGGAYFIVADPLSVPAPLQ